MPRQKGFTFLELLIVVAIVGIIGMIAFPSLARATRNTASYEEFGCGLGDPARECTDEIVRRLAENKKADEAAWNELQEARNARLILTPTQTQLWEQAQRRVRIQWYRQQRTHRERQRISRLAEQYLAVAKSQ